MRRHSLIISIIMPFCVFSQTYFEWLDLKTKDLIIEKSAILLPIYFTNIGSSLRDTFYVQFDLGSEFSVFNKSKMDQFNITINIDSFKKEHFTESMSVYPVKKPPANYNVEIFEEPVDFSLFKMLDDKNSSVVDLNAGNDKQNMIANRIIGTIGMNYFSNKLIEIDFLKRNIAINKCSEISNDTSIVFLSYFRFEFNKIILNLKIQNTQYNFLYDSGSSYFTLIADEKLYNKLTPKSNKDRRELSVPSWDNYIQIEGKRVKLSVDLLGKKLNGRYIYRFLDKTFFHSFPLEINGIIGNNLFLNDKLYIDLERKVLYTRK